MTDFSIGDAVGAGFNLIAKRPLAVIVWGIVYVLIAVVPLLLFAGPVLAELPSFIESVKQHAASGEHFVPTDEIFALEGRLMMLQPVMLVATLGGRAFLTGAIYRGVLEPENRSFLSMRFGKQELWLALLFLAYQFVLGFAFFGIIMIGCLLGLLAWGLGALAGHPWGNWLIALMIVADVIAVIVAMIWVGVRLSLAPVITFADKEFRLFESWALTKGHVWKLFGLALVLIAIGMAFGGVVYGVMFAGMISSMMDGAGGFDPEHVRSFFEGMRASPHTFFSEMAPRFGILFVIGLLLTGPFRAIFVAPWAVAYRELVKGKSPDHPAVF
jgi:hypothetical protein